MSWLAKLFGKKAPETQVLDEDEDEYSWVEPETPTRTSAFNDVKDPRASFTITGFEQDRIRVEFDWNDSFIEAVHRLGFVAETDEDTVQMFFYASSMRPTGIPSETQDLSAPEVRLAHESNRLVE